MVSHPYVVSPDTAENLGENLGELVARCFINEPGEVSFGTADFVPGRALALHHHHTWELIIVDPVSEGPGFTRFGGQWWRVDPGSAVFLPKGYPHAWSAGSEKSFLMLWVYAGSFQEAGREWHEDNSLSHAITPEEEKNALVWTPEAAKALLKE